jgi:hypothetical protein
VDHLDLKGIQVPLVQRVPQVFQARKANRVSSDLRVKLAQREQRVLTELLALREFLDSPVKKDPRACSACRAALARTEHRAQRA